MALIFIATPSLCFTAPSPCTKRRNITRSPNQSYSRQLTKMAAVTPDAPIVRRSGNYSPSEWSSDFIQSLTGNCVAENTKTTSDTLKGKARSMISKDTSVEKPLKALELVDDLQRLGVSYHFKDEIKSLLNTIYTCHFEAHEKWGKMDLNLKALGFRLLRQHGYHIPQEIFEDIKNEAGNIKSDIREDVVAMLNLYEASFFGIDNENIIDEARKFTTKCLKEVVEMNNVANQSTLLLVTHALELPLHWRIPRFESIWYIDAYKGRSDKIPFLSVFSELDYNIMQGIHQEDLQLLSRWWVGLQWDKKLTFARDRMVQSFMWAVGANHEPSFDLLRRNVAKNITMINVIDDVYDVYGTLEELEQFTQAVRSWDINAAEGLPDYMKTCFVGFYNTVNEMAYTTLINKDSFLLPYVKKAWTEYCEANLVEARWYHSRYTPTLEEYLNISRITVSVPAIVLGACFLDSDKSVGEALHNVIHWSAIVLRLADDLGTSSAELERGDVPKAVECYMHETGVSREEARTHIKKLIIEAYKKINKERMACKSTSMQVYMECASNLGRMGQFTYERGDIFNVPDDLYKRHHVALLFEPKP